ncbi:MAG: PadR family transcriptional regulator [Caldisphaera sp.]|jgi:DNA-binding PadR family transcriptional regulator|nr:PadR family transcriptional regulator [Caldisphaera sp.]
MKIQEDEETQLKGAKAYRESLLYLVLRILAEKPSHGYEIMKKIEEMTHGRWKPAAGTLYPLLDNMQNEGLIEIKSYEQEGVRGGKKIVYSLTFNGWLMLKDQLINKISIYTSMINYIIMGGIDAMRRQGFENESEEVCNTLKEWLNKLDLELEGYCKK